jgi:hypothetical protein
MTTKKRTIKIVRQEAMKRVKKIQLNFEQFTIKKKESKTQLEEKK